MVWGEVYFLDAIWCFLIAQRQRVDRMIYLRVKKAKL